MAEKRGASASELGEPMLRYRWLALVAAFVLLAGAMAQAEAAPKKMRANPGVYVDTTGGDCGTPLEEDIVAAFWAPGEGNFYSPGDGGSHALYLQKFALTSDCAAAGAEITGVAGITITQLGFDVRTDGDCGAGSPRFNVYTESAGPIFFGCSGGAHTVLGDGWVRVTFDGLSLGPVEYLEVIIDEGTDIGEGFVYLDNINVNGTYIGGPGNA